MAYEKIATLVLEDGTIIAGRAFGQRPTLRPSCTTEVLRYDTTDRMYAVEIKILGMSPHAIQISEEREEFAKLLTALDIPQPENVIARSLEEAQDGSTQIVDLILGG